MRKYDTHSSKSNFRSDRGGNGPREMYKAICSNCGRDCEVPFRPTGEKPVLCSTCFREQAPAQDGRGFSRFDRDRGPRRREDRGFDRKPQDNKQMNEIISKLDKIIELLTPAPPTKEEIREKKKKAVKDALEKS